MIKGGYILQPRNFDDSAVAKMPPCTRELWFYLLRKVTHEPYKGLERGQGFFTLSQIQKDLSWHVGYRKEMYSKPQLTKSIRRLCEGNAMETTKATHGIIVTICNYDHYQRSENYEGNSEGNDEGNTKETKGSQYKQEQYKNNKNNNILLSQVDKSTLSKPMLDYFEITYAFWKLFRTNLSELKISTTVLDKADFDGWVKPIKQLIETDKKSLEDLREAYRFLKSDDFWAKQIRSTAKLRKKDKNDEMYIDVLLYNSRSAKKIISGDENHSSTYELFK